MILSKLSSDHEALLALIMTFPIKENSVLWSYIYHFYAAPVPAAPAPIYQAIFLEQAKFNIRLSAIVSPDFK
jgi:hypothetical protein